MKKIVSITLLLLVLTTVLAEQDVVFQSDGSSQVQGGDEWEAKSSGPGGSRPSSPRGSSGRVAATVQSPNNQAQALKSSQRPSSSVRTVGGSSNAGAESALRNVKWIRGGRWARPVIYTPCFHNPCPKGKFTFYIIAACSFTVQLVDQSGNVIRTIGTGYGWYHYAFEFYTDCGRYRLKITLDCPCGCSYVCFKLEQDRSNCFNCPDRERHFYNPETCSCQCANECKCPGNKIWRDFPSCTCTCERVTRCRAGQYFNAKNCRCQPYPTCSSCPLCPRNPRDDNDNSWPPKGGNNNWPPRGGNNWPPRGGKNDGQDDSSYDVFAGGP